MPVTTRRAAKPDNKKKPVEASALPQHEPSRGPAATGTKKRGTNDAPSAAAVISTKKTKTQPTVIDTNTQVASSLDCAAAAASYNLRSSTRATTPATVTPANVMARRLAPFDTPTTDRTDGIVDIYDPRQPCVVSVHHHHHHHNCHCPSVVSHEQGTELAFAYLAHYGKDFGQVMKERELSEHAQMLARLPRESHDDDDDEDKENASRATRRSHKSSSEEGSKASSSSSSSKYTPPANAKFYPRELNLQHPSSSPSSGEDEGKVAPNSISLPRQPELTTAMRTMLVNWMVEVCKEYSISDDALHLSVTLVDRALLQGPTEEEYEDWDGFDKSPKFFLVHKSAFQALGCACILIASKLEDRSTPKIEDLCYISDNSFSELKLRELEEDVCKHLSFRLSSVTPHHFINEFLRASHACPSRTCQFDHPVLRNVVLYILALSRLSYELSLVKPSLLAAASIYLARATLGIQESDPAKRCQVDNPFWSKTLEHYTGYSLGQLKPVVMMLHNYQSNAESTQDHKGIFAAFRNATRKNASLKTAVPRESLCLANVRSSPADIKAVSIAYELF